MASTRLVLLFQISNRDLLVDRLWISLVILSGTAGCIDYFGLSNGRRLLQSVRGYRAVLSAVVRLCSNSSAGRSQGLFYYIRI